MVGRENTHRCHRRRFGAGSSGTDGNRSVKGMRREKRANSGGRERACYFPVAKRIEQISDRREFKSAQCLICVRCHQITCKMSSKVTWGPIVSYRYISCWNKDCNGEK